MSEPPPLLRDQRKTDREHLQLLSIFHFVGTGLAAVGLLGLFVHYSLFQTIIANPNHGPHSPQNFPPTEVVGLFKWFYLVFALWFVGSGILNALAGCFIRARKHRTFLMIVAGINCLHVPLGTVLGVFTIIVLARDSVRELYDEESPAT